MSSDQSGQTHVFAFPSLISPQRFGDCRCQGDASLLPCISSLRSNRALRHACRIYQVLSQFEGEDACDRADCVHRDCCLGSSLSLRFAVPLRPLGQVLSRLLFACDVLECSSLCNLLYVFLFIHQRCCDVDFLLIELVAHLFVRCFLCFRSFLQGF